MLMNVKRECMPQKVWTRRTQKWYEQIWREAKNFFDGVKELNESVILSLYSPQGWTHVGQPPNQNLSILWGFSSFPAGVLE